MNSIVFAFPKDIEFARKISEGLNCEIGEIESRRFPDGETYVRVLSDVKGKEAIVVCSLDHPDEKLIWLFFLCSVLKDLGSTKLVLVAPYLAYMRQDKRFHPGEAVSSEYIGKFLSDFIDEIITIDPHLHRRNSLSEIYSVPGKALHCTPLISDWIHKNVSNPILIGPDAESSQWVSSVAQPDRIPYIILEKIRMGDLDVKVSLPDKSKYSGEQPILIDDIVSSGKTLIETIKGLKLLGLKPPICIAVHGIFAGDSYQEILNAGVFDLVTTNTISHSTNKIDVSPIILESLRKRN
ncbi:phosphoribosylpyrophosphate synthetase [Leptospira perolatii]|uniref:ribose-phosphate diphosphokinase n=1 Tax=Leptospira perolatii TaxID=2023191 RepID=A0A2M9ZLU0_9LEPT|nr:ribose-phosphate pyrophosphokinase [Leptospira perolatii]PJZ69824.1 phosphoribosylpyrophosphate synthetase [Leptospira perolatii]PJZ72961.1 phosphoribosylpyrophosphate synthetase [Leptospira perolatii]